MQPGHYGLIFGSLAYFVIINNLVDAGPASRRVAREIYPELEPENDANQSQVCIVGDVVYGVDETVPAEQPCLKCRCQPPGVQCVATRCFNKKPGCKALHRPNQCCPDYQCECEYNGRKYSNGERLETSPGDECKVCYCRGGEIQCTDVSCYVRNDCEGKQVPGQCCPKYDHCPTRDSLEKLLNNGTNPNSIPEGIIIIPSTSNEAAVIEDPDRLQTQTFNGIQSEVNSIQLGNSLQNPKITIQEIIPDVKEIPITPNPKSGETLESEVKLIIEEPKTTQESQLGEENSNDLVATDSDAESSEITEVIQNPPPVIRIGDNLLFLKKNELVNERDASSTPASIITLVGAEGLQRGGFEEVIENITNIDVATSTSEKPYSTVNFEDNTNDLTSASSSHILSLVKKKKKPSATVQSTTQAPTTSSTTSPSSTSEYSSMNISLDSQDISKVDTTEPTSSTLTDSLETSTRSQENMTEVVEQKNVEDVSTTLVAPNTTQVASTDDQPKILELEVEQNPSYPTLPDMMTRYNDEGWIKIDTDKDSNQTILVRESQKESKILHDILEVRNNNSVPKNSTQSWLKSSINTDDHFVPLINLRAALPLDILNAPTENDEKEAEDEEENATTTGTSAVFDLEESSNATGDSLNPSVEVIAVSEETNKDTIGNLTELVSSEPLRSVETMENSAEYSGEKTTPKNKNPAPLVSDENASIEDDKKETEANDMLFVKEYTIDLSNDEETKESDKKRHLDNSTSGTELSDDVEMINVSELESNKTSSIPEKLPVPEKLVANDKNEKDVIVSEDDAVFSQLNQELGLGSTERPKTAEEEDIEARRIFQELLEETSTPKSQKPIEGRTKETEALERVSQALAKLALRGSQPLDTGVLSVLRDFFSSQYRAYDSKSP